jgi:two-component system alkaline phosphatase synthesis response regulator PhoP
MPQLYVVEDDDSIRELLVYALGAAGYRAQGFVSDAEFAVALADQLPDLVLLDIMLPGVDGIEILRRLRASFRTKEVPVVMLTAKGAEYDRIKGLDLGADDYITKPFSVMEVIARVRAVLRRSGVLASSGELEVAGITLQPEQRRVLVGEREVPLTYKEFELLAYLMLNVDIVLSRERILDEVWGYSFAGQTRTVDMHIRTLRKKLGDAGAVILTVRHVGYKIARVSGGVSAKGDGRSDGTGRSDGHGHSRVPGNADVKGDADAGIDAGTRIGADAGTAG